MEFYNPSHYLKLKENYISEIVFINANPTLVCKHLFYITFSNKRYKNGYFLDNDNYLRNLYFYRGSTNYTDSNSKNLIYLEKSKNLIQDISPVTRYYSYIKVIEDKQNPQFENQIMILQFGSKIFQKLKEFTDTYVNNCSFFDKTFKMVVDLAAGLYPNYDKCYFTDKDMVIIDNNLNLESELNFKKLNVKAIERKEKLEQINNNIIQ